MAPSVPAFAQSESKAYFLQRLGLTASDRNCADLYNMMKTEAVEGRFRLCSDRGSLVDDLQADFSVVPSYAYNQISERAMSAEILRIFRSASPETKHVYMLGGDAESADKGNNWVIRWMLWHVFRYRDPRNGKLRARWIEGSQSFVPAVDAREIEQQNNLKVRPYDYKRTKFWDPIRDE